MSGVAAAFLPRLVLDVPVFPLAPDVFPRLLLSITPISSSVSDSVSECACATAARAVLFFTSAALVAFALDLLVCVVATLALPRVARFGGD
jgi:hypothetical protein